MFLFLLLDLFIEIYFRLFLIFHRKVLLKIQKSNQCTVGISTYSSDKKGIDVAQFWLSFYVDAYSFPPFPPFFGFIAETCPKPSFFNPRAFQPPKQNIFSFLYIFDHIDSRSK